MKNLILVSLFGKYNVFIESNGKIKELNAGLNEKHYSTGSFYGPKGVAILSDEIPYVNGKRTIDNMSFNFGMPIIPIMDIGINLVKKLVKEIGGVYIIVEPQTSYTFDSFLRKEFKDIIGRDVYKGTASYAGLVHSIASLYYGKHKKGLNIIAPNYVHTTAYDDKKIFGNQNGIFGITSDKDAPEIELYDEFVKRFSKYLDLYEEDKKIEILKGMFLGGYYSYIYENKEDDIVNRYQDRKYVLPFKEIKRFIDEVQIPAYKKVLVKGVPVYSINLPTFNDFFKEYNPNPNFIMPQDDFILYSKMLIDFNNDNSIKPFKLKDKDFIWIFGPSLFGRKSKEFQTKQIDFIEKAIKKNKAKKEKDK